jgi:hypothetical protein
MDHVNHPHDHPPDEFDHLLDGLEATAHEGNPEIEVTVAVPLSSATLSSLAARAAREGKDVSEVVAAALRTAAA